MRHTSEAVRDANLLGAASLAVAGRLQTSARDAALVALASFLDGARIEALAMTLGVSHSGAVRLVDRLASAGAIERAEGPDGRSVAIRLTDAGRAAAARLAAEREAVLLALLAPLEEAERGALRGALERVLTAHTAAGADPRHTCRLCDADACGHPARCPVTLAAGH